MNAGVEELHERMECAVAGIEVPSGLAQRAARHRRRRILTWATAAAATAVVVAGAAIAVATAPRETSTVAGAPLMSDIKSALDAVASNDIMYTRTQDDSAQNWYYQQPQEIRQREMFTAGKDRIDLGTTSTAAGSTSTIVDYTLKNVFISTVKQDALKQQPGPQTSCATPAYLSIMQAVSRAPGTLPADLRKESSCGQITRAGTEKVNGVRAIKLLVRRVFQHSSRLLVTLWVNPANYLPVQWQWNPLPNASPASRQEFTWDVWWLPPSRANLDIFRVPIPAGFTKTLKITP